MPPRVRAVPVRFNPGYTPPPPPPAQYHVPSVYVNFNYGVHNTPQYPAPDGCVMPDVTLKIAEDPDMGYGAFTTIAPAAGPLHAGEG